jgi:hypothetical protein
MGLPVSDKTAGSRARVKGPSDPSGGNPKPFDPKPDASKTSHGVHLDQGTIMGLDPPRDRLSDECRTFVLLIDDLSTPYQSVLTLPS